MREDFPTLLTTRDPWPEVLRYLGLVGNKWSGMITAVGNEKFEEFAEYGRRECSNHRGEVA